jgi:DNA-binding IclR family transcriptional regulator
MGSVAAARYDITAVASPSVRALARESGESAFLSARRGDETVCLLREEGSFPLRSFVLYEGARFPLGVASAGMAIIAYLPDGDIEAYLDRHELAAEYGPAHSRRAVLERIALTRRTGWALNPGLILEGSWGMGAAVFDGSGRPAWALSLTGVESRFTEARQGELGRLLLEHAHHITQALRPTSR